MKKLLTICFMAAIALWTNAQDIDLVAPSKSGGASTMEALWNRHSGREYSNRPLSEQQLSDLLFAASGINRPESGKITSPTALNRQEIDLYVFTPEGIYFYDKASHKLVAKAEGDHRDIVAGFQDFVKEAPVVLLMVANAEKFGSTEPHARDMMFTDAGIMSQNVAIYCAATGLECVPRASMDVEAICNLLGFDEKQIPALNMPVGFTK